ncbi:MAG: Cupin 2 conserved barrel domain protein [Parcubacteria group bacterium]|nr:Cupin 2 conserved barrel domain protein [Parcubacteria group bacterium]
MEKRIINISEVELSPRPAAMGETPPNYDAALGFIGPLLGAKKLGYSIVKLLPGGNRAFPLHNHRVNEELFIVWEGEGEVRIGETRQPIKKGDFIACPSGDASTAHQIVNTSDADLTYIGISTKLSPEICDYPDSGKFGVLSEDGFRFIGRAGESLGYFEGEA